MDLIPETALAWHRAGRGAVLATVVKTWGSAPRPVGAQMVVDKDGAMQGSVSGGCVEGAVILEAIETLSHGGARLLTFGVSDDDAFEVGLACGGEIQVLVEPVGVQISEALLDDLVAARARRDPVSYQVDTRTWNRRLIPAKGDAHSRFADGVFHGVHQPPLRIAIVGAVHIAQHLVAMAVACGWDPTVIDPRPVFAAQERFPGRDVIDEWPDAALTDLGLDRRTAVVTLTHDPKLDLPAIETALRSDVPYLGCLGSTRTHAKRVAYLQGAGFSAKDIARIHGPVGLDIGAGSPAEIAVSIMAELTRVIRR